MFRSKKRVGDAYTRYKQEERKYLDKSKGFMYTHMLEMHGDDMNNQCIDKDPIRRIHRESVGMNRERYKRQVESRKAVMNMKEEQFGIIYTLDLVV